MLPSQQDHDDETPDETSPEPSPDDGKQVSEVTGMDAAEGPQVVSPEDATAGYPDSESGGAQEGTAGPNAAPEHDSPRPGASGTDTSRG